VTSFSECRICASYKLVEKKLLKSIAQTDKVAFVFGTVRWPASRTVGRYMWSQSFEASHFSLSSPISEGGGYLGASETGRDTA